MGAQDENDVHVWASFLKLWLRELKEPVMQGQDVYMSAMQVASEHMRRLKELEEIANGNDIGALGASPRAGGGGGGGGGAAVDLGDANAMAAAAATVAAAAVAQAEAAEAEHAAGLVGLVSPRSVVARTTSPVIAEGDEEEEDEDDDAAAATFGKAPAEPEPEPEPEMEMEMALVAMPSAAAVDLSTSSIPTPLARSSSSGSSPTPTGRQRNMRRRGSFFAQSTVLMPSTTLGESVAPEVVQQLIAVAAMLPSANLMLIHHLVSFLRRVVRRFLLCFVSFRAVFVLKMIYLQGRCGQQNDLREPVDCLRCEPHCSSFSITFFVENQHRMFPFS